ncbi:PTS sugar transporter subunit IIA [Xylocopilactobacillus apis]|uniref:PTS sugar transporter subunit IIA n=1 Tax=Xylocopilactobacillus apis TaxID=2932183 RepID=A0AAU9D4E7_9LACO|nr:hypothetical protein [Xylocopilactobacillus apis]BDR55697.1 PTS sugar transporter subunit IIA [Xylocopilactobacillus apis]
MKVLLTSHGHLAQGLVSGFEFIAGKSDQISALELDSNGISSYHKRLKKLLDNENVPVLILTDLKGGTPYNESFKYYLAHKKKVRVISGVNLPMLLELIPQLDTTTTLEKAAKIALMAGTDGITQAQDESDDNDEIEF